jgi:hypothetical protein
VSLVGVALLVASGLTVGDFESAALEVSLDGAASGFLPPVEL